MSTISNQTELRSWTDSYVNHHGIFEFSSIHVKHGDKYIPEKPITDYSEAQFMWLAAFHKAGGKECTPIAHTFMYDFEQRSAFVVSLDRGVGRNSTSGVTVSTKHNLVLELGVEALRRPLLGDEFSVAPHNTAFTWTRYLDTFLEHERVVVATPGGMRVMM